MTEYQELQKLVTIMINIIINKNKTELKTLQNQFFNLFIYKKTKPKTIFNLYQYITPLTLDIFAHQPFTRLQPSTRTYGLLHAPNCLKMTKSFHRWAWAYATQSCASTNPLKIISGSISPLCSIVFLLVNHTKCGLAKQNKQPNSISVEICSLPGRLRLKCTPSLPHNSLNCSNNSCNLWHSVKMCSCPGSK